MLGQITNTNARVISEELARIGVDVYRHTVVGDNLDRMIEALRSALDRSDVVIVTGGLGPTPDDLTREAVAGLLGIGLERREELVATIEGIFARLNRPMPVDNLRQADLPVGAVSIPPEGTAPGFYIETSGKLLVAVPGVPWEMRGMLSKTVIPLLRQRGADQTIVSREVLVVGLGESHTHERIADVVEAQSNPTIAYRAAAGQVRVRLSAKAGDEDSAMALIEPVEQEIRARLAEHAVPGSHRDIRSAVGALLRSRDVTVAVAESLTGGQLAMELTFEEGSSEFFKGGVVAYWSEAKRDVLGVDEAILQGPGAVSAECAAAMAEGVKERFGADLGLATTGVAGPATQEGKPVGTIFVGASFEGNTETRHVRGYGDRSNVRALAVTSALDLARRFLT